MRACVTGGTGFVGAHIVRALAERGDDVRVVYRNADRLKALRGVKYRRAKCDVLDYRSMRRALRGIDVLFHVAGNVASNPVQSVWEMNAEGPVVAVEAAERHGIDVVVVNPAYVLGVPVDHRQGCDTSTRTIANYLRGRLPGVLDAPMNFVDVEDVAAGQLLAGEHGRPGERYILGGVNLRWAELIDRVAELSDVRYPIMVLPTSIRRLTRIREAIGLPGALSAEASNLMGQDWRFTSKKARDELGYTSRPLDDTLNATIEWVLERIEAGAFDDSRVSGLSRWADSMRMASRLGLLAPVRVGQRVIGRRIVAGG
ncbi:MAG: NAD-dependent epimerase/dehydratase family protein [Solirubrobacteraceae bacterium]